jgi:hypothetical protein
MKCTTRHHAFASTLILISLIWVAGSPSARADSCLTRIFSSIFAKKEPLPDPILRLAPGSRVEFPSKGSRLEGEVISHSFDEIKIRSDDGKDHRIKPKHSGEITEMKPPSDSNSVAYRLWELRKKTRISGKSDLWQDLRPAVQAEVEQIRQLSKTDRQAYLERVGDEVLRKLKKKYGNEEFGFHYNLHGGALEDYVDRGGIMISQGDIALNYGHGDPNYKVYFFRSSNVNLYHLLSEGNPQLYGRGRMGNVLMVFPYDSEYILRGMKEKGILRPSSISLDFDEKWVRNQEVSRHSGIGIGIPATEFLAPPAEVFVGLKNKVGMGGLSRDEETLATMRYLDRFWSEFGR